jgi:hypothetical protein
MVRLSVPSNDRRSGARFYFRRSVRDYEPDDIGPRGRQAPKPDVDLYFGNLQPTPQFVITTLKMILYAGRRFGRNTSVLDGAKPVTWNSS